jgi:hypothetical protein
MRRSDFHDDSLKSPVRIGRRNCVLLLTSAADVRQRLPHWIAGFAYSDIGNQQAQLYGVKPARHEPITDNQRRSAL